MEWFPGKKRLPLLSLIHAPKHHKKLVRSLEYVCIAFNTHLSVRTTPMTSAQFYESTIFVILWLKQPQGHAHYCIIWEKFGFHLLVKTAL